MYDGCKNEIAAGHRRDQWPPASIMYHTFTLKHDIFIITLAKKGIPIL